MCRNTRICAHPGQTCPSKFKSCSKACNDRTQCNYYVTGLGAHSEFCMMFQECDTGQYNPANEDDFPTMLIFRKSKVLLFCQCCHTCCISFCLTFS